MEAIYSVVANKKRARDHLISSHNQITMLLIAAATRTNFRAILIIAGMEPEPATINNSNNSRLSAGAVNKKKMVVVADLLVLTTQQQVVDLTTQLLNQNTTE